MQRKMSQLANTPFYNYTGLSIWVHAYIVLLYGLFHIFTANHLFKGTLT